jgi:Uma2 family endonuclease
VAFVPYARWPRTRPVPDTNAWDVLPDLCVEVVSPTDAAEELRDKITEYFQSGVRLVWVVYPRHQVVDVYDGPTRVRILTRADALDGGPVLPGFQLPLAELFPAEEPAV